MTAAYLYDAIRTPFGRYGGALSGVRPDDLGAEVIRALLGRLPDLDPHQIDDVLFGATVNRLCGSSLAMVVEAT